MPATGRNGISGTVAGAAVALTALVAQTVAVEAAGTAVVVRIALPATMALVFVALWPYRRRLGTWVAMVGLCANLAVILANGGLMPIERATLTETVGPARADGYQSGAWIRGSKDVLVSAGGGHAVPLGDSIVIRTVRGGIVASPGDLVVWAGLALMGAEASLAWQRRRTGTAVPSGEHRPSVAAEGGATTP